MFKVLFIVILISTNLFAQKILTAEEAISIGLKNNYDIQIARNSLEISKNNTGKGTAGFLPTLNISGNHQYAKSQQETNSPFSFGDSDSRTSSAGINFSWTLFDGFRMFAESSRYNELAKLGEHQSRNIIENTVVAILHSYFNSVQQQQLLQVSGNTLEISKTRLEKEKIRQELGSVSSTDYLNAKVAFNNDNAEYLNQQLNVLIAKKNLNILLGRDPLIELEVAGEILIPQIELNQQELMELAEKNNSTLLAAETDKLVAEKNIQLSRSAIYPRLSFDASYFYTDRTQSTNRFTYDIKSNSKDAAVGFSLSLNLFNGWRDNIDIQNAKIDAKNKELAFQNAKNNLAGLVREKFVTFEKRMELLLLEQQNVEAARQNLELQKDRYQIGTVTSLEFRDAQVNLARAETALIVSRFQARISRLEIEQLIGKIEI